MREKKLHMRAAVCTLAAFELVAGSVMVILIEELPVKILCLLLIGLALKQIYDEVEKIYNLIYERKSKE